MSHQITQDDVKLFIVGNRLNVLTKKDNVSRKVKALGPRSVFLIDGKKVLLNKSRNSEPRQNPRLMLIESLKFLEGKNLALLNENINILEDQGLNFGRRSKTSLLLGAEDQNVDIADSLAKIKINEDPDIKVEEEELDQAKEIIIVANEGHKIKVESQIEPKLEHDIQIRDAEGNSEILTPLEADTLLQTNFQSKTPTISEIPVEKIIELHKEFRQIPPNDDGRVVREIEPTPDIENEDRKLKRNIYDPVHEFSLGYFFGNAFSKENWSKTLTVNRGEVSTDRLIFENNTLYNGYGNKLLIEKLVYGSDSDYASILKENIELLQLYFRYKNLTITSNMDVEQHATMKVKDLLQFRSLIARDPVKVSVEDQIPNRLVKDGQPVKNNKKVRFNIL